MIKKIVITFSLIVLAALFFAPQIIGNYVGSWVIDKYLNTHGATLTTKNIALSWMGPQELQGISLSLKDGSTITADKITVNASALSALTNRIPLVELNASNVAAQFLNGALQLHRMNFSAVPEENNFRLTLEGLTTSDNQQGQFLLEGLVNPSDHKILDASGTIDNLPVALVDKFTGGAEAAAPAWASAILGATANVNLQKTPSAVLVSIDTSTLKGKFSLVLNSDGIDLHNTTPLTFKVSPELFQLLKKDLTPVAINKLKAIDEYTFTDIQFALSRAKEHFSGLVAGDLEGFPVQAKFSGALKFPRTLSVEQGDEIYVELQLPPKPFNALRQALYGQGSGDYLLLEQPTKMRIDLVKLDLKERELVAKVAMEALQAKNAETGEIIHFPEMHGQLNALSGQEFSLEAHAGNSDILVTRKGQGNLKVRATFNGFFYGIFSDLLTGDPMIRERAEATMGNNLNGEITLSLSSGNGYVNADLKGDHGSIDLSATLAEGLVTLRTPFILRTQMSPHLATTVLGPLLPFLASAIESDQGIELKIEPDQFSAPITDANLTNINVGNGSLQLGRVQFRNSGAIESMLSVLKPAAAGQISVWFTPAYFSIHQGILSLQRLDMFVMQAYHMALWGSLNFNEQTVDMKLGMGATALNKAFSMPNPLSPDEMVAFPLRGPFGNASVDKARALTQITGLIAKLQGTPQGFIIGTFIQAAGRIGEDPIPAPTTTPFPWKESQVRPSGESAPSSGGSSLKKPIKQLIKIIGF